MNKQTGYQSYLLRLWPVKGDERTEWRASLENPHTGEQLAFTSLKRLFTFLEDQTINIKDEEER